MRNSGHFLNKIFLNIFLIFGMFFIMPFDVSALDWATIELSDTGNGLIHFNAKDNGVVTITSYQWSFLKQDGTPVGSPMTGQQVSKCFPVGGPYKVKLVVNNTETYETNTPRVTTSSCSGGAGGSKLIDPLDIPSLDILFQRLLDRLLGVVALLVLPLAIVYSGFLFITAQGNPEKIKQARATFKWTIIGAVVILAAKLISVVITETLKGLGS